MRVPRFTGKASYYPDLDEGPHRLFVAVACIVGDLPLPLRALLDTGSHWCVLPADIARALGYELEPDPTVPPLQPRFGILSGRLERISIRFRADEGQAAEIEASWFLSEDWIGPIVIGWKGCLERLRFALDPDENGFYFGESS